ncbi:hypothetical protein [Porticoccus sp.]
MNSVDMLWSPFFGSIGPGCFVYGSKHTNTVVRFIGVTLRTVPKSISNHL